MCEVDSYNGLTKSKQNVEKKKKERKTQTREGTDEKGEVKDGLGINCKEGEEEISITIATAVFLLYSNNCFMSDASPWY